MRISLRTFHQRKKLKYVTREAGLYKDINKHVEKGLSIDIYLAHAKF